MITEVGSGNFTGTLPDKIPNVSVALYNGTLASFLRDNGSTQLWTKEMKIFINNTRYLRITNGSGSNQSLSYCGVQTKGRAWMSASARSRWTGAAPAMPRAGGSSCRTSGRG